MHLQFIQLLIWLIKYEVSVSNDEYKKLFNDCKRIKNWAVAKEASHEASLTL